MAAGVSVADGKAMAIKFHDNLAGCYFNLIQEGKDNKVAMKMCNDKIGDAAEI